MVDPYNLIDHHDQCTGYFGWFERRCTIYLLNILMKFEAHIIKSILIIAIGFGILGYAFHLEWVYWLSVGVATTGIGIPPVGKGIVKGWEWFGKILGAISSRILLTVIFFIVLTPIAVLSRLFGSKDPLNLKNRKPSTFEEVQKTFSPSSLQNPW